MHSVIVHMYHWLPLILHIQLAQITLQSTGCWPSTRPSRASTSACLSQTTTLWKVQRSSLPTFKWSRLRRPLGSPCRTLQWPYWTMTVRDL